MLSERFNRMLKVVLGILPICYGGIIVAMLPSTLQWAAVMGVVLIALLVLVVWLDLPLQTVWPVFPGVVLLLAGSISLSQSGNGGGPATQTPDGLLLVFGPAALYIVWAMHATWRATHIA